MNINHFYDPKTRTLTYVVWCPATLDAVVVAPVRDFDPGSLRFSEDSINELLAFVEVNDLRVHATLETHVHADHVTAAHRLRERLGSRAIAGSHVLEVRQLFMELLDLQVSPGDGGGFDTLLGDGESFQAGSISVEAIHTPGHTPACVTYRIGDALFTGDALFMPDSGTGRCDFPKGDAGALYDSIVRKLYPLPDEVRVFVGHDYQPAGREVAFETTIGLSKTRNIQVRSDTDRERFIQRRAERDASLALPRLMFHSVQVNIRAGRLPPPDAEGRRFLKLPILGV